MSPQFIVIDLELYLSEATSRDAVADALEGMVPELGVLATFKEGEDYAVSFEFHHLQSSDVELEASLYCDVLTSFAKKHPQLWDQCSGVLDAGFEGQEGEGLVFEEPSTETKARMEALGLKWVVSYYRMTSDTTFEALELKGFRV